MSQATLAMYPIVEWYLTPPPLQTIRSPPPPPPPTVHSPGAPSRTAGLLVAHARQLAAPTASARKCERCARAACPARMGGGGGKMTHTNPQPPPAPLLVTPPPPPPGAYTCSGNPRIAGLFARGPRGRFPRIQGPPKGVRSCCRMHDACGEHQRRGCPLRRHMCIALQHGAEARWGPLAWSTGLHPVTHTGARSMLSVGVAGH